MTSRSDFESMLRGPAFLTDAEAELISELAKMCNGDALEIGVGYGGSTVAILCNLDTKHELISVDPFVQDSNGSWRASAEEANDGVIRAVKTLTGRDSMNWRMFVKPSREFFSYSMHESDVLDDGFGLVFIDGDHNYSEVKQDIEMYAPLVLVGGFLALHDARRDPFYTGDGYAGGWEGPTRCGIEIAKRIRDGKSGFELYTELDSMVVFKRISEGMI